MSDARIFKLSKRRTRSDQEPLLTFLKGALGQPVILDLDEVDRLDSVRLKTVLSARRHWLGDGVPFQITNIHESCETGLRTLGVSPEQIQQGAF